MVIDTFSSSLVLAAIPFLDIVGYAASAIAVSAAVVTALRAFKDLRSGRWKPDFAFFVGVSVMLVFAVVGVGILRGGGQAPASPRTSATTPTATILATYTATATPTPVNTKSPCTAGCAESTVTPTPIPTHPLSYYANKIVEDESDIGTYWFVDGPLTRYSVPDSATLDCLTNSGFQFIGAINSTDFDKLPVKANNSIACGKNALYLNQRLFRSSYLRTSDGNYTLKLQADGNLVLSGPDGTIKWENSKNSDYLVLQNGGNLVAYQFGGNSTWATNTGGTNATKLAVQNGGKLILYTDSGTAVWDSVNGKLT